MTNKIDEYTASDSNQCVLGQHYSFPTKMNKRRCLHLRDTTGKHSRRNASTLLLFGTAMNRDLSTGPLTRPFACSLAPLTHSLASHRLLRSCAPLRSFVCSLAHSLTPELVGK